MSDIEGATEEAALKIESSAAVMHEQLMAQLNDVRLSAGSMLTTLSTFALEALNIVDTRSVGIVASVQAATQAIAEGQDPSQWGQNISQWWENPENVVRLWATPYDQLSSAEQMGKRNVMETFTHAQIQQIRESLGLPVGPSAADIAMLTGGITGGNIIPPEYTQYSEGMRAWRQERWRQRQAAAGSAGQNPAAGRGIGADRPVTWGESEEVPWGSQINAAWQAFMSSLAESGGATRDNTAAVARNTEVLEATSERLIEVIYNPDIGAPGLLTSTDPRHYTRLNAANRGRHLLTRIP